MQGENTSWRLLFLLSRKKGHQQFFSNMSVIVSNKQAMLKKGFETNKMFKPYGWNVEQYHQDKRKYLFI